MFKGSFLAKIKTMQVIRVISVFNKSERLLEEINIDFIPFNILKEIFENEKDNPFLIKPCIISEQQINMLNKYLLKKNEFTKANIYQLDCFKVDDN
jgi:hypothetical protein